MTGGNHLREHTEKILQGVIERLDPSGLVADAVDYGTDGLTISSSSEPVAFGGRLIVMAIGKASVPMAAGAISKLGGRVDQAIAVCKHGIPITVEPPMKLEVFQSDHPVPTQRSLDAGRRLREIAESLTEDDVVLMLISGGGSALVEDLLEGISLEDLRQSTEHLLRAGATINQLNAVRRRLSRLKGGRLARTIAPARVVNLIVSDVLGNPLQDIASGPTVEPDAGNDVLWSVLQWEEAFTGLPEIVQERLKGAVDTDEIWPGNVVETTVLADSETAARSAAELASDLGYRTQTLGFDFQGEGREFGRTFGTIARHACGVSDAFQRPLALIGSGELTVTVRGNGSGGRNTEMALAAALEVDGLEGVTVTSFATDGDDGTSGFAGATVDGGTINRARELVIDVIDRLNDNDSATVCTAVGAAIDVGPTGTNVNDLYLALIGD